MFEQQKKGVMVDICPDVEQNIRNAELDLDFATSVEEAANIATAGAVDYIIINEHIQSQIQGQCIQGLEIAQELWQVAPNMPMLVMCPAASGTWAAVAANPDPRLELIYNEAPPVEIRHRLAKLLRFRPKHLQQLARAFVEPIPALRNKKSGRLDAELIATFFGLTLMDVSRAIGKAYSTVHKTPDSASLQSLLYSFERIASALKTITGGRLEQGLRIWLNAPNKAFPNDLPVDLIKQGHLDMLTDMLEDVLLGHPR